MHGSAPWSICPLVAPGVRSGNRCRGGDRLDAALAAGARDGLASGGGAAIRFSRADKALTETRCVPSVSWPAAGPPNRGKRLRGAQKRAPRDVSSAAG